MEYIIITNNSKVYNFYKETNEVLFYQKKDLIDLLEIIREKIYAGHILLSDPILSTLDNLDNPYKSVAISKADFLGEILIRDDSQKKMIDSAIKIAKKLPLCSSYHFSSNSSGTGKSFGTKASLFSPTK